MDKFFRGFLYFAFLLSAINLYLSWDFSIQSYNEEKYYSKFFNKLENTYSKYGSINEDEFPYNYDKSKGFYYEACYSPDKKQIATSHSERGIEIFDVDTKELIKKVGNKSAYSIRYSPDGKYLAAGFGYPNNKIEIWDLQTEKIVLTLKGHFNIINGLSYSPNGEKLASASSDGTIRIWDTKNGDCLNILSGCQRYVEEVVFDSTGKYVYSTAFEQPIKKWDIEAKYPKLINGLFPNYQREYYNITLTDDFNMPIFLLCFGSFLILPILIMIWKDL